MIVKRIYMNNTLRNYNYLVACDQTKKAVVIDPYDGALCLKAAQTEGLYIQAVVNTHAHHDHIRGNAEILLQAKVKVYAHPDAIPFITEATSPLSAGNSLEIGNLSFGVLDTPGHTLAHICLLSETRVPVLFCGDTLFNAGAGNCHSGDADLLYETFTHQLSLLEDETLVYPGHDYIENNLKFSLDREPHNETARCLLEKVRQCTPETQPVNTLGMEKQINPFFRLDNPEVIEKLSLAFPDLKTDPRSVFIALRQLRDRW